MRTRSGLRIRCRCGVHPDVRRAFVAFAAWLRKKHAFRVRCPVYLSARDRILSREGEDCFSLFFEPMDRASEPYISIATGDYVDLCDELGDRDDALAAILGSLAFQLQWYFSWVSGHGTVTDDDARQAADALLAAYADCVDTP